MGSRETIVSKDTQKEACRLKMRLLRNNRGQFRRMYDDGIVRAGLEAPGSSDLIGMTTIVITQEMVGSIIGIATVTEVKEPDWEYTGKGSEEDQLNFITQVRKRGGIGFFLNDAKRLGDKLAQEIKRLTLYKSSV